MSLKPSAATTPATPGKSSRYTHNQCGASQGSKAWKDGNENCPSNHQRRVAPPECSTLIDPNDSPCRRNFSIGGGESHRCAKGNHRRLPSNIPAYGEIQFWPVERLGSTNRRRRTSGYFLFRRSVADGHSR